MTPVVFPPPIPERPPTEYQKEQAHFADMQRELRKATGLRRRLAHSAARILRATAAAVRRWRRRPRTVARTRRPFAAPP